MLFAFKKDGTSADEMEEKKLSFPPILRDWLNVDVDSLKLMFDLVPVREFPRLVDGGAPAGVVDMLLKGLWGLSGVEGGLDSGNLNILCGTSSGQVGNQSRWVYLHQDKSRKQQALLSTARNYKLIASSSYARY